MIYENICKIAKEKNLSINQIEKETGLSTGSICKWGKDVSPTIKSIKKVADMLGKTVDELIEEQEV